MRNRTVQSVLARRHMFNNGGMVPPTPKASGILASSPSLVDAVSNDALSDMGGGTLSMAQGGAAVNMQPSYVFNEGGIAKFNLGGSPNANVIISKVLNGTANADEIRAVEQSSFMQDPRVAQAVRVYKGDEPGFPIPLRPDVNVGEKLQNNKVRDLKVGNLTDADRAIPTQEGVSVPNINSKLKFDSDELRRMGATEAQINEERNRVAEINSLPLSTFKQPAIDINAPSPGEEAIVNIAESALTRPVPQVEEPKISAAPIKEVSRQDMEAPLGAPPDGSSASEIAVIAEKMPPPFDSSGDQGEEPPTVATPEEVKDQNQLFANLAVATNKNTETDAVEAVVEVTDMMGGEGGAVGADGTMTTGDDTIIVRNDEGESKPVNSDVLISAFKLNGPDTDENLQIAVSDDIIKMGDRVIDGKPTNMDSLRKRIEALIPAVEEDSQTQGLLIAMLGASIAGGESPNALKNISDGMQKALPGLISFGSKQKAARQARQTSIAKLVLGEELKIAGEDRAVKRAKTLKDNTPSTYLIRQPGEVGGQKFGKNSFTTLTAAQAATPEFAALRPIKIGEPTAKLEDILGIKDSSTNLKTLQLKGKIEEKYTRNLTLDNPFDIKGLKINYYKPTEVGKKLGNLPEGSYIEPREFAALTRGYKLKADPLVKLITRVNSLKEIDPKDMTGFTGMKQSFASTLRAFGGSKEEGGVLSKWADAWLNNADSSAKDKFSLQGRYILAQIAPIFLNESGKTISDSDRARVAELLGFSIERYRNDKGEITGFKILDVNDQLLKNPDYIRKSIDQVNSILTEKLNGIKNEYIMHSQRFGTSKGFAPSKSLLADKLGQKGMTPEELLDKNKVLKVKQILAARKKKKP